MPELSDDPSPRTRIVRGSAACRPAAAKPAELPLAADGKALVPVVVSEKASPATKQVAAELADYLGRITGAKFEVAAGDGTKGIVLGTLAEFPDPALAEELAIRNDVDGREAFAIRTEPDAGPADRGHRPGRVARRVPVARRARLPLVLPGDGVGGRPARRQNLTVAV